MSTAGTLFVVATPLGNLEDITLRALRVLKEVDLIAAEDTRHSRKLLERFDIKTRMTSYHDHVEQQKAGGLVHYLETGKSVALISDAGTPCIADPGYRLVKAAVEAGVRVEVVPGPSSVTAALSVSGLPTDRFVFEGFVPVKEAARRQRFQDLASEPRTLVFLEAARRLAKTLPALREAMGDRRIVVARELTKLHEDLWRGRISEVEAHVCEAYVGREIPGEITLVVSGADDTVPERTPEEVAAEMRRLRASGMSLKEASRQVARTCGIPAKEAYRLGIDASEE